jgi:hypothetical protein
MVALQPPNVALPSEKRQLVSFRNAFAACLRFIPWRVHAYVAGRVAACSEANSVQKSRSRKFGVA